MVSSLDSALVKRFLEFYRGDEAFRSSLTDNPHPYLEKWDLDVDPEGLRILWDTNYQGTCKSDTHHSELNEFFDWRASRVSFRETYRNQAGSGPHRYQQWRERQIARLATQAGSNLTAQALHLPFAIELTHGCSVGCDYCCFAAPHLDNVIPFNATNERLFRSTLDVLDDYFGPAAKAGFLYWATEPLDNRDYEKYLRAFFEKFEVTPQTTTAAWYRNMPRTRRLLDQSRRDNGMVNRLSINSLEHLHLCMKQFTAQELIDVDLVLQNQEALTIKHAAGRGILADSDAPTGTSACVSGFLINLVERTIKLISPCTDLARWPLGYAIYQESRFEDTDEVAEFIKMCDREVFTATLDDDCIPKLRDDFIANLNEQSGELTLSAEYGDLTVSDGLQVAILKSLDNGHSVRQIVRKLMEGHDPAMIYFNLQQLNAAGIFESLPNPDETVHLV